MDEMREIGRRLQAEQNLSAADIVWLTTIAQAILRAFIWSEGQPMRTLATTLGVSPQTWYTALRGAVQALLWVQRHKTTVATLVSQLHAVQSRVVELEQTARRLQAEVHRLTAALAAAQSQLSALQAEVTRLPGAWTVMQDRLIVVLKLSGRCTVRSIVEVLEYGLGLQVSVGYVQGVISQAGLNAHSALARLLQVVPLSGAISVDEVYLKELGQRIFGIVIVDPLSGLILRLTRCADRSKATLGTVLQAFATADIKARIKLCLTDMYEEIGRASCRERV